MMKRLSVWYTKGIDIYVVSLQAFDKKRERTSHRRLDQLHISGLFVLKSV